MLIQLKNSSVNYDVHPAIRWAEPLLAYAFARVNKTAMVTSAKDEMHSENSRHFWKPGDTRPSQAVDLRIRDPQTGLPWFGPILLSEFAEELTRILNVLAKNEVGGHFTLQSEGDHFHLEWNPGGIPANIKGYLFGREVYLA